MKLPYDLALLFQSMCTQERKACSHDNLFISGVIPDSLKVVTA